MSIFSKKNINCFIQLFALILTTLSGQLLAQNNYTTLTVCEHATVTLSCGAGQVVFVQHANYGRLDATTCAAGKPVLTTNCIADNSLSFLKTTCTNKQTCSVAADNKNFGDPCRNTFKYLSVSYTCVPKAPDACTPSLNPCGIGAICTLSASGTALCRCPVGKSGNPNVRCCKQLSCSCSGDPHCYSFDGAPSHFQGRCKYDLVSTYCRNSTLPAGLVPFALRQKQIKRNNVNNAANVAFIDHYELSAFGNEYKLLQKVNNAHQFTINGADVKVPFQDLINGVQVYTKGGNLIFATNFGLTISWDGNHKGTVTLCDAYANYTCGLCGNADGNLNNDYTDRNFQLVPLIGSSFVKYYKWGSHWKVPDNGSIDIDGSACVPGEPVGNMTEPSCKNASLYSSNSFCGLLNKTDGIWAQCIQNPNVDKNVLSTFITGCNFDMCSLEGNATFQQQYLCNTYQKMTEFCYESGIALNLTWNFSSWPTQTNCVQTCGPNQVYEMRRNCPATCLFPDAKYDCGELSVVEGCYCASGYVADNFGNCVLPANCGCKLPTGDMILAVGSDFYSLDCAYYYTCNSSSLMYANQVTLPSCSENAKCTINTNNVTGCVCNNGFRGNGYNCTPLPPTTPAPTTTTTPSTPASTTETVSTTTKPNNCLGDQYCYGYGDPHYRSFGGFEFYIKDVCTYILASDKCVPGSYNREYSQSNFTILVDHEHRYSNNEVSFIKSIQVYYLGNLYEISQSFQINGEQIGLPFTSQDNKVSAYKEGKYITIDTSFFNVQYDGVQYLKLRQCSSNICGVCAKNNNEADYTKQYLIPDNTKNCN